MTTAFKPGDKVRYSKAKLYPEMKGWEAEVVDTKSKALTYVRVTANPGGHSHTVGKTGYYMTNNLELIEEKEETKVEHEHKVGDRVTVKGWEDTENPSWEGRTGTVYDADHQDAVCVKFDDDKHPNRGGWEAKYLVPAEKPFGFEDIQEGDTIRRTKVYKSGALEVREGTVGKRGDYYWADETGHFILAYDAESETGEGVTYELLERPEPPKEPEIWEDRKPGDKLVSYFKHDGKLERIFTKQEDGEWSTLVMGTSGKLQKGFPRSDKELAAHLKKYGNEVHLIK